MSGKYFVVDTNVLLSAMLFPMAKPGMAVKKATDEGRITLSPPIIQELSEKFSLKKFDKYLPLADRLLFLDNILASAYTVEVQAEIKACSDPDDDMFLDLAVAVQAHCIVTGDKALLELNPFRGIPILRPAEFIASSR
jgi:uncharacterized protein